MAKHCQGISVHAVSFDHRGGPAFYASLPGDGETLKECRAVGAGEKNRLVSILLDHVAATGSLRWKYRQLFDRAAFPIHVVHDPLGRPQLLLGEYRGPAISFSAGGGKVWAALCGNESDIGIDLAAADEFQPEYPLRRVFQDQELQHALRLTGGDLEKASALLWSIKEAVVKALGCAFHLVAPRQVHVYPSIGGNGGHTFPVHLSAKALERFPAGAGRSIWVRSFPQAKMWLSIALLRWRLC
ncbi:MAG: 4'-phosphopantetheinyl transferase superfamily protein [Deltaproteobacteria bacterium]|nr:4'-phosphopantetheinyl transferase superfamily protein [Deltaproteobacteria bacterium]